MDATSEINQSSKPRVARELDIATKVIILPDADITLDVDIAFETASIDEAASKVDEVAPKFRTTVADDVVSNKVDGVIDSSSSDVPVLSEKLCQGFYAEHRRGNLVAADRSASRQEVETPEGKSDVGISALSRSLGDVRYEENSRELNSVTSMNWNARQAESARTETEEIGESFLERNLRTKECASSSADSEKSKLQYRVSAWEGAVPKSRTAEGSSKTGKGSGVEKRKAKGLLKSSLKRRIESMERRLENRVERILEENVERHPWLQPIETWIADRYGPAISHIATHRQQDLGCDVAPPMPVYDFKFTPATGENEEPEIESKVIERLRETRKARYLMSSQFESTSPNMSKCEDASPQAGMNGEENASASIDPNPLEVEKEAKRHNCDLLDRLKDNVKEKIEDIHRVAWRNTQISFILLLLSKFTLYNRAMHFVETSCR